MKNSKPLPCLVLALALLTALGGHLSSCFAAPGALDTSFGGTGMVKTGFGGGVANCFAAAVQPDGKLILAGYGNPKGNGLFGAPTGGDFLVVRFGTNNDLDRSFGKDGVVITQVTTNYIVNISSSIKAVLVQPDGKIVVGGYSIQNSNGNNQFDFTLARYNTNGSLDTSFGTNGTGIVLTDFGAGSLINALTFQFGTNLIAAGRLSSVGGQSGVALASYDSNGRLVPSFGSGGKTTTPGPGYSANAVITEGDGSILAAGSGVGNAHSDNDFALFHYSTNGVLDSTFSGGGEVFTRITTTNYEDEATTVALQAGSSSPSIPEKIVVAGTHQDLSGTFQSSQVVIRYNLDGTVDTTFGINGVVTNLFINSGVGDQEFCTALNVQGTLLQPRKITIGGWGTDGTNDYITLARLTVTGAPDTTFGTNNSGRNVFNPFGPGTKAIEQEQANCMVVRSGDFVLAGQLQVTSGEGFFLTESFTSGGLNDVTSVFSVSDAPGGQANAIAIQRDGKIVVAGNTPTALDVVRVIQFKQFALARYNPDGSLDTTFGFGGKVVTSMGSNDIARAVAIQADGKIVAGGSSEIGNADQFALTRYNPDGSLDASFGNHGTVTAAAGALLSDMYALKIQPDGKIVAAGAGLDSPGKSRFTLLRFNTDGTLDTTFGLSGKVTTSFVIGNFERAQAAGIAADGKIVAAGFTELFDPEPAGDFATARYNTNGSLGLSFGSLGRTTADVGGGSIDLADAIAIQPDGKILVAGGAGLGGFPDSIFGAAPVNSFVALVRLNTNGTLDSSFGEGGVVVSEVGTFEDFATAIALQSDGKIIVTGGSLDETYQFFALRYNADGSVDTSYGDDGASVLDFGSGTNEIPYAVTLDSQGRALLAGDVGGYFGVVRLQGDVAVGPLLNIFLTTTNTAVVTWPFPSTGFALQQNTDLINGAWGTPPQTINNDGTNNFIVVSPPVGNSFYRLFEP